MKKRYIIAPIVLIPLVGLAVWMALPLFVDKEVNETLEDLMMQGELEAGGGEMGEDAAGEDREMMTGPVVLATGSIEGRAGHSGSGTVRLLRVGSQHVLQFESDFDIENGPDLQIHLGSDGSYDKDARIAKLKGNIGSQVYVIPESIDPADYNEFWIWCRAFSVPFVMAELIAEPGADELEVSDTE